MKAGNFQVVPIERVAKDWVVEFLSVRWGSPQMVTRGQVHDASRLPGFAARYNNNPVGLVVYAIHEQACEIVVLDSSVQGIGIGTALIEAVKQVAVKQGCKRLWLITTNDNLAALGFYQKRGFELAALHRNALQDSRRLKPQISRIGLDGIPLRDEIELEMNLAVP